MIFRCNSSTREQSCREIQRRLDAWNNESLQPTNFRRKTTKCCRLARVDYAGSEIKKFLSCNPRLVTCYKYFKVVEFTVFVLSLSRLSEWPRGSRRGRQSCGRDCWQWTTSGGCVRLGGGRPLKPPTATNQEPNVILIDDSSDEEGKASAPPFPRNKTNSTDCRAR